MSIPLINRHISTVFHVIRFIIMNLEVNIQTIYVQGMMLGILRTHTYVVGNFVHGDLVTNNLNPGVVQLNQPFPSRRFCSFISSICGNQYC